ncbi:MULTISPECIES: Ohr family peroxiredoxin [Streptomyces violaceusniger group]|uniref:Organic hydroperoxide resistance protein n=2 Tax=Streptomyces rhizosphaericus TaxID=114699 RepID=A0ABN1PH19_9ACTN|nr:MULTISPECIES: Ohr family peroxiredoxin [Streptomyces violaceusniger group]
MADLDIKYIGVATADDGRDGRVVSDDGVLDLTVTPPPGVLYKVEQMRSVAPEATNEPGTNPEQLLAAGYCTSFHGALGAIAKQAGVDVTDSKVTAKVAVGKLPDRNMGFYLELCVSVPKVDDATALELAEYAQQIDPYLIAMKGNADIRLTTA